MAPSHAPVAGTLLVTRPQPQADEWVRSLRARGVAAQALPLLRIEPVADPEAVAAWASLASYRLLMFVSPGCVESFFALRPSTSRWPANTLAAAPGPGTAQALRAAGVPAGAIVEPPADAPQFDSEALWQRLQVQPWQRQRVLVVRGDGGRDWLAQRLRERGAEVTFAQAYRRTLPSLDAVQRSLLAAALAAPAQHGWLFSSSQAAEHLNALAPQIEWAEARALATHPRIAASLRALGALAVWEVRPTVDAVAALWTRSIQSTAPAQTQRR